MDEFNTWYLELEFVSNLLSKKLAMEVQIGIPRNKTTEFIFLDIPSITVGSKLEVQTEFTVFIKIKVDFSDTKKSMENIKRVYKIAYLTIVTLQSIQPNRYKIGPAKLLYSDTDDCIICTIEVKKNGY